MTSVRAEDVRRKPRDSADYAVYDLLDLSALLGVLGYAPGEFVSIGNKINGVFCTEVCSPARTRGLLSELPVRADIYFGINPIAGPPRKGEGRGTVDDVTRLAALPADLDVKSGGCADESTAQAIIDELSDILGTRPSAITHSGSGGLHPYWPITDGVIDDGDRRGEMVVLLKRWGRLVKAVAKKQGAAADSVFDLSRVLRAPGTYNNKAVTNGHGGIPVVCYSDAGAALTLAEVEERLGAAGVYEANGDNVDGKRLCDPNDWEPTENTCRYMAKWLGRIAEDGPNDGGGRHQWLLSQGVRLACAVRLGCLSADDYAAAQDALERRMVELRAETGESVPQWEVPSALEYGIDVAATKTDAQARAELHDHKHVWPAPDAPRDVAKRVVAEAECARAPWCYWNNAWFVWRGSHYEETTPDAMRDGLYDLLGDATYLGANGVELRWKPSQRKLNEVIDAARGLVRLPDGIGAAQWIDGRDEQVIPCANGLLRVRDRTLVEHTPKHFNIMCLPYTYDRNAKCPRWLLFLKEVFGDDTESVGLLREWFGYVLSGRTNLQKMVMWLGPKRGGKGTVARLLKRLVGESAYGAVKTDDLRDSFALENLVGKSLVVFPDERQVGAPDGKRLVQFVLQATGEDDITVRRKYKSAWSGRLPMRVMYMGNEPPVLPDSSGAVQNRILTIETVVSFAGKEDRGLDGDLADELPGILNWALDGLDELLANGEMKQPESGLAAAQDVDEFSNHIRRYLKSGQCRLENGLRAECQQLWHDFDAWCQRNGIEANVNAVWFGRHLRPAMRDLAPGVKFARKQNDSEPGRPYYYMGIGLVTNRSGVGRQKW